MPNSILLFVIFPVVNLLCVEVANQGIQDSDLDLDLDLELLVLAGLRHGLETNGLGLGNSGLGLACDGLVTSLLFGKTS